ncbi:HlyD family efflux transporter periplasmic adaptor subunit [Bradyrhizobium sp. 149]|uniref:efflux RND transporter periplasmic adaptor subunit n=1 Tax=Bradyrhizobium sp. 149 TaxID=2782624 RepID=UPI001FFB3CB1|nr:HlyD family efflux transporter periplasmic adaptor subunit [Bradyrhizobium sp. 149]MCK1651594.1 HlyD family efflux transporter periplasmic adaptor subunit [Bradyrhizobium sp. 149]
MVIAAALASIVAMSPAAWFWQGVISTPQSAPQPTSRVFKIVPSAVTSRLTITGTLKPGRTAPIVAPFDGFVLERKAQLGDRVAAGDTVLIMDTAEAQSRVREAQAILLKATMAFDVLVRWERSPDVTRAKRALENAEAALAIVERQVSETKTLLDRGIVSRNEFDGLVQQRDTQRMAADSSRLDLQTMLDRGNAENRQLADLEVKNALARLGDLKHQLDGSTVVAPSAGVLVRPPVAMPSSQTALLSEPGSRVSRGQPLFAVADLTGLVVTGKIDEVDINRVHVGQPVTISSDAFSGEVLGRIVAVSAEASGDQSASSAPSFEVRAAVRAQGALLGSMRVGMSARMTIELASDAGALIVPVEAVRGTLAEPRVRVRDPESGQEHDRRVALGATSERGVQVLNGLEAGEIIVFP